MFHHKDLLKKYDTRKKRKRLYTPKAVYVAKDGHKCNSMEEVEIDNFLYIHKIPHDKPKCAKFKGQYYRNSFRCPDWLISGVMVEYFGGFGWIKKYDKNTKEKEEELERSGKRYVILHERDNYVKILYKRFANLAGKHKRLEEYSFP